MNMKINKDTKIKALKLIISLSLVIMLGLGAFMPVLAADYAQAGDKDHPAQAAITKLLHMPAGTSTPAATFNFQFKPIEFDDDEYDGNNMPSIDDIEISFDGTENAPEDDISTTPGKKTVYKESENIIASVVEWPRGGIYRYEVTEEAGTYSTPGSAGYTDEVEYSKAMFLIEVYVDNKNDGSGETYVKYIVAKRMKNYDGSPVGGSGSKVDPTPGGDPEEGTYYSQMIFNNTYMKKTGGTDPTNPADTVLEISKTVTGDFYADDDLFHFDVTINNPAVGINLSSTYLGYIVQYDVTEKKDVVVGSPITFTVDSPQVVDLMHGQRLTFTTLPVGAKFEAMEAGIKDYTAKLDLMLNGDITKSGNSIDQKELSTGVQFISEGEDRADFINVYKTVTPTGIGVDDLPYIVIIALTLVSLGAFIILIYRKNVKRAAK